MSQELLSQEMIRASEKQLSKDQCGAMGGSVRYSEEGDPVIDHAADSKERAESSNKRPTRNHDVMT